MSMTRSPLYVISHQITQCKMNTLTKAIYNTHLNKLCLYLFKIIIVSNTVSCSFIQDSKPPVLSNRHLSDTDKTKYQDAEGPALMYLMPLDRKYTLSPPQRELTPEIKKEMNMLLAGRQRTLRNNLERGEKVAKLINQVLIDEGVPGEFIYLAMIESGFQNNLRSPMGAAGMWQFMKGTAKQYGLRVDMLRDERNDIVLSTIAAARHLKDLYDKYKDWKLVLAGYNAGVGTVDRAVKAHQSMNFWQLARNGAFRKETVTFVPKFLAIVNIMDEPERYGLDLRCLTTYKGLHHRSKINQKHENKSRTGN